MELLKYGNTNTFYIAGTAGGLLVDTDYAGTLPQFFKAIKSAQVSIKDITYLLATHYHPDHIGLAGELQALGVTLLIADVQLDSIHFADGIFSRDSRLSYRPIDERAAYVIRCTESRDFLARMGIGGALISTPSHSADSISVILDNGDCLVGDLEPLEYLAAYDNNPQLKRDWEQIMQYQPKRIFYGHANPKVF